MYSWQIHQYLSERNYLLEPSEYEFVTDLKENPQISRITYRPFSNDYYIATKDGFEWIIRMR